MTSAVSQRLNLTEGAEAGSLIYPDSCEGLSEGRTHCYCVRIYSVYLSLFEKNWRSSGWNGEKWTTWPAWFNELLEIARCKKLQYVYITMCALTQFSVMTVDPECIVASYEVSQVTHFMFQALFPLLSSLSMRSSSLHSQLISTLNNFSSFLGTLQAIADSATKSGWCF